MGVTYLKEHQIATIGAIFKAGHSVKFITVQTDKACYKNCPETGKKNVKAQTVK